MSANEQYLHVVPQPHDITYTDERFDIREQNIKLKLFYRSVKLLEIAKDDLKLTMARFCKLNLNENVDSKKEILLGLPQQSETFNSFNPVRILLMESLNRIDSSFPTFSTKNVRLGITKLPGKYFTEWMMPNPILIKVANHFLKLIILWQ